MPGRWRTCGSWRGIDPLGRCDRTCGSGLAREDVVSANIQVADTPPSRASPLPQGSVCVCGYRRPSNNPTTRPNPAEIATVCHGCPPI
ncbi:hypothetical protein C1X65_08270 [Pseudomonas sp. FW305-70]|nr:hypothetical protein C1X65_08270 [Pseudomonas sp. FW305-70]